nr:retrovirus-related Pol polyprotein from transposon TNT 1-94 [Tanacetum cinerariifolium]
MAARDSDDALVFCFENRVKDRIMDFGASFHATYCKEELERFKLRSGKVRLVDDKTLDIASIEGCCPQNFFWYKLDSKGCRYIPGLKRRLILVGQLDEEGYHVDFGDQQWKVTKDIPENLAENDSIVVEHGLSSKITQSPGESSDTSEGSENIRSFEDSGRSDEEYSKNGASSKVGGFETPRGHFQNLCLKLVASKDKEVNMAARDSDDALVFCFENRVKDRIMDFGASFHATYCKEELERFKLRSGKVRLVDDKTLDIASIEGCCPQNFFWYKLDSKGCRYILGLKRRLILVGQLDEEGYHVDFGDQQWKVTKGSLVVARRNKRRSLYMVKVHPQGIGVIINGSGSATV